MMRESPYLKADRLGDVLAALQFFSTIRAAFRQLLRFLPGKTSAQWEPRIVVF